MRRLGGASDADVNKAKGHEPRRTLQQFDGGCRTLCGSLQPATDANPLSFVLFGYLQRQISFGSNRMRVDRTG
jgi:hypothetical protein